MPWEVVEYYPHGRWQVKSHALPAGSMAGRAYIHNIPNKLALPPVPGRSRYGWPGPSQPLVTLRCLCYMLWEILETLRPLHGHETPWPAGMPHRLTSALRHV